MKKKLKSSKVKPAVPTDAVELKVLDIFQYRKQTFSFSSISVKETIINGIFIPQIMDRDTVASQRFSCTDRERCLFEAGIKMGTIYHQYVGSPVNLNTVESFEKAMADSIRVQPYVTDAVIKIDRSVFTENGDRYSYISLTGNMIDAIVRICINGVTVTAEMRYDKELRYPLMYISNITESE